MSINPNNLVQLFRQALSEGWGYIYGSSGETWTKAKQDAATREQTVKWGKRWIGKRVTDCSGLFVWAFKQCGGTMYHGSNTMFKSWSTASGTLSNGKRSDGQELKIASAVYKYSQADGYHHVGLYIGDGKVIEAKGTYYGVVQSKVAEWSHWSELKGVAYGSTPTPEPEPKEEEKMQGTYIVNTPNGGAVNVRTDASTSSVKQCTLPVGTKVTVVEECGDFARVQYERTGYIMKKYLQKDG